MYKTHTQTPTHVQTYGFVFSSIRLLYKIIQYGNWSFTVNLSGDGIK